MKVKLNNGKILNLGEDEVLEDDMFCPECGGQLITSYGAGISCTFCTNDGCLYSDYDYNE